MKYYRRYPGDYMRDTAHLSLTEHGVYTVLLDLQYGTEKALPVELPALCRLCRATGDDERAAVRSIVNAYFPVVSGGRWNPRARHELTVGTEAIARMRVNGAAAARKRWGKDATLDTTLDTTPDRKAHAALDATPIHPPTTNHQPPTTNPHPPAAMRSATASLLPSQREKPRAARVNGHHPLSVACSLTWIAYCEAYHERYSVDPTRNARANAQIMQLVKRLGANEAPHVARFFLTHNDQFYVKKGHAVGLLVADAEKLRTEWATDRRMTTTRANQLDRTSTMGDIVREIITERGEKPH